MQLWSREQTPFICALSSFAPEHKPWLSYEIDHSSFRSKEACNNEV
jgi:hypothetical protein